MSAYPCVWSTHVFSTWAAPGAILISQSRVSITFAFPPQSSKRQAYPIGMCTYFSGLPLHCLPCSMLIWILFFYQKFVSLVWFTEYSLQSLLMDLSLRYPFSFSYFRELHLLCTSLPSLFRKLLFPRSHFSVMMARELRASFHPQPFKISSPNNYATEILCRDNLILEEDYFVSESGHSCSCSLRP